MLELASPPQILSELPTTGLKEGPYLFENNGIYYLTYPHVANKTERLEYATSNNPLGPFKFTGVIMDESASGCWTNHQSIIKFKNQWYLFYHNDDLSPQFDKNRAIRCDSLFFNADNTIKKVIPTFRGVGLTKASSRIQLDRFSDKDSTVKVIFLDTAKKFEGWKTVFTQPNSWIRYNRIDFKDQLLKSLKLRGRSVTGARIEVHLNSLKGRLLATIDIPKGDWRTVQQNVTYFNPGVGDLLVVLKKGSTADIDWLSFN
jgi:hypothetical protein